METSSGFEKEGGLDSYWRRELSYSDLIYDYIEVEDNEVVYRWEEMYWGGSSFESRRFEFSGFVEAFEVDSLSGIRH